jgi:hypothetical protein
MQDVGTIRVVVAAWIRNYYLSQNWIAFFFSAVEHYISTVVASMFCSDAIYSRWVCEHPFSHWWSPHPKPHFFTPHIIICWLRSKSSVVRLWSSPKGARYKMFNLYWGGGRHREWHTHLRISDASSYNWDKHTEICSTSENPHRCINYTMSTAIKPAAHWYTISIC